MQDQRPDHAPRPSPSTLTLFEVQNHVEAVLQGAVEPQTARALAELAGFQRLPLTRLAEGSRDAGCLARIDGRWRLIGDPVRFVTVPFERERMSSMTVEKSASLSTLALSEPFSLAALAEPDAALAEELLNERELELREGGIVAFRVPAVADAIRRLSPEERQAEVHREIIRRGKLTLAAARWAAQSGEPLRRDLFADFVAHALAHHEWAIVTGAADLADDLNIIAADERQLATVVCGVHLDAAYAARFLAGADTAHGYLDRAAELVEEVTPDAAADFRERIAITRAELLHYHQGDLDSALDVLDAAIASGPAGSTPVLAAQRIMHLVYGGRHREADAAIRGAQRVLHRGSRAVRTRVAVAGTLVNSAFGRPQRALRTLTILSAQQSLSLRRTAWVEEELQASYGVLALGADGPSAFPFIEKQLSAGPGDFARPDLVAFYLMRCAWEFSRGEITEASRLASIALDAAHMLDPSGFAPALMSIAAEGAALVGNADRARTMLETFAAVPLRSSAVVEGGIQAHIAAARLMLRMPGAGAELLARADELLGEGKVGFAAEALYTGVRLGRRRAAHRLVTLADDLDGRLHAMHLSHARALLEDDGVALLQASDALDHAGLRLHAVEAAAQAAQAEQSPAAVRGRAEQRVAAYLADHDLPGHALLQQVAAPRLQVELTPREREIAGLIDAGLRNTEIAERLQVSLRTVEGHIARMYRKTGGQRRSPGRSRRLTIDSST